MVVKHTAGYSKLHTESSSDNHVLYHIVKSVTYALIYNRLGLQLTIILITDLSETHVF